MESGPIIYETDGGLVLLDGDQILGSYRFGGIDNELRRASETLVSKVKENGKQIAKASSETLRRELSKLGVGVEIISDEERERLDGQKLSIMVRAGFASNEEDALRLVREKALRRAEAVVSEESSRLDLHLVHAIQALDEHDKFLNITTERVFEWYSLHFPELAQILQDNLALSKLIIENGKRENFEKEKLQGRGLSDKKVEAILMARDRSKGGEIADRELNRIFGLAETALKTAGERDRLAEYVESSMRKTAPNVAAVAGATIGARLIAKAAGLDRLARLPASTIQILGAEKALFRALRTGARPPKHGILFQHQAVHSAPKWQRGKIARTIANKVAIAARVDYFRGEQESTLPVLLEKRLEEIKVKYKEPRAAVQPKRQFRNEQPALRGKRRKERARYKESRSRK